MGILKAVVTLASMAVFVHVMLQKYSHMLNGDRPFNLAEHFGRFRQNKKPPAKRLDDVCGMQSCPKDQFSFFIFKGAAKAVAPQICINNKLVLGKPLNNAGSGVNVVVVHGRTGQVVKTGNFNMKNGDDESLIDFLWSIEQGSAVLMASYDDPATNEMAGHPSDWLSDEARDLIGELGSSAVHSLSFRDNWVFAGGKSARTNYEKTGLGEALARVESLERKDRNSMIRV
ncbi:protein FAM3C-like [Myripristis murdjan]|uniref:protein FAM3C-like n=1 Tax=Myripristis murdjan TaxID=586833 RepID=UPI00117640FA|nr:protein FAM3C-like [Myripristis murdjan]